MTTDSQPNIKKNPLDTERQRFTTEEAANIIGVTRRQIYEYMKYGILKATDVTIHGNGGARSIRITRESIESFLSIREIDPAKFFALVAEEQEIV